MTIIPAGYGDFPIVLITLGNHCNTHDLSSTAVIVCHMTEFICINVLTSLNPLPFAHVAVVVLDTSQRTFGTVSFYSVGNFSKTEISVPL